MPAPASRIDAAILAGGLGTRISGVLGGTPKVLAPIGELTFLEVLLLRLEEAGIRRVVLCLGHLADAVLTHLERRSPGRLTLVTVVEPEPLGTAGALRFALAQLHSDPVLVVNGDSLVEVDLPGVLHEHQTSGSEASMLCVEVADARRYGRVVVGGSGTIEKFVEKDPTATGPALINAGLYCFGRSALERLAAGHGPSLERDFLAKLPPNALHAIVRQAPFIDIGTPESLSGAGQFFGNPRRRPSSGGP